MSKLSYEDKVKIYQPRKERYSYRRITLELRNQGYRTMIKLGLKPLKRNKRKCV